jgi:hypothetical protein
VRNKAKHRELYYVLVYLAPPPERTGVRKPDRFFVLTQSEINKLIRRYQQAHPHNKHTMTGFNWTDAHRFEDAWGKLPR